MPLSISSLSAVESVNLALDALTSYWPSTYFRAEVSDSAVTFHWQDGPHPTSVRRVVTRYQHDPELSDWRNAVILGHPEGGTEVVVPTLPVPVLNRVPSAKTVMTVTSTLREEGMDVDGTLVAHLLRDHRAGHPAARAAREIMRELSLPLPPTGASGDMLSQDDDDLIVWELCDAVANWDADPARFGQWEVIFDALVDPELRAVLVSLMVEQKPQPGTVGVLLGAVSIQAGHRGRVDSARQAERLLSLFSGGNGQWQQQQLFPVPASPELAAENEIGVLLRDMAGAPM